MKTGILLVATLFALTSLPLLGQQPQTDTQPATPRMQQNSPPGAPPEQPTPEQQPSNSAEQPSQAASPAQSAAAVAEMHPVQGELISKLDTQTAKTGDSIVIQTKSAVKTADGTEIPKGSKLVGHVVAVQPSSGGTNSQVALQFDQAELTGGKKLPIHSEIQSIEPPGGATPANEASGMDRSAASGSPAGATNPGSTAPGTPSQGPANSAAPGYSPEGSGMGSASQAAGTVVGKTGNITIKTTAVPGVLLANNTPGQQDPRMAQSSGILLGAKKDVKLEGGTEMVLAVATVPGGGAQ